jgi:superfamily II DNA or RNA helicase|tara:strand:- start:488 stop:2092 length:1605 start_codon:yes stop_codon:yes gene_type:complete
MSKQIELLKKMGEANLLAFINPQLLEILEILEITTFDARSLAGLIIDLEGHFCIAENRRLRESVFKSLSKAEAIELCLIMGLEPGNRPWAHLLELVFRKSSKKYINLLEWLEIDHFKNEKTNEIGSTKSKQIAASYPLFSHQIIAAKKSQNILSDTGRLILHMPTGAGKTRTAMNIISEFLRSAGEEEQVVIWLAHSEELCEQAAEEFEKAWSSLGNRSVGLVRHFGRYTNESINISGPTFVVVSLQGAFSMSMSSSRDRDFFALSRKVGLTVIDEAHKAIASTYQHVLEMLAPVGTSKLLGLTATPGRSWLDVDEDEKLADFFDRQKVSLEVDGFQNPVDYLRREGYLATQETVQLKYFGTHELSETDLVAGDFTSEQLTAIGQDLERNLRILQSTEAEAKSGGKIILFACSVEHAKLLTGLLHLRGYKVACIVGTTKNELREQYISDFKDGHLQILVNFGVLTTGFDAPKADVAIIARPTQSLVLYSQMVGRVVRGPKAGGTETCRVITVVDQQYGFRDLSESFDFWDDLWE